MLEGAGGQGRNRRTVDGAVLELDVPHPADTDLYRTEPVLEVHPGVEERVELEVRVPSKAGHPHSVP